MALKDFTPQDTDDILHIYSGYDGENFGDVWLAIRRKWPEISPDSITIKAEYIHCRALGYDLYDSSDYDNYLVIERIKS